MNKHTLGNPPSYLSLLSSCASLRTVAVCHLDGNRRLRYALLQISGNIVERVQELSGDDVMIRHENAAGAGGGSGCTVTAR